jgi:hypothetical protein
VFSQSPFQYHPPEDVNGIYVDLCRAIVIGRDVIYRVKRCKPVSEVIHSSYRDEAYNGYICNQ